eukprot:SAG31_NODE_26121_length_448_cov_0.722063_1_plen_31_part_10
MVLSGILPQDSGVSRDSSKTILGGEHCYDCP